MAGPESLLPHEQQYGYAIDLLRDDIIDDLMGNVEKYDDIINPYHEFGRDVVKLWELSAFFAQLFADESEHKSDIHAVIYKSMCFALEITTAISAKDARNTISIGYLADKSGNIAEAVREEVSAYLTHRPEISNLIEQFMHEIDHTQASDQHVELAAGLIFMLSERDSAIAHTSSQASNLTPQDFTDPQD